MMDYYSSRFPLIFAPRGRKDWSITIGQRTWYSVPKEQVDDAWRRHEDWHKHQWKRDGYLVFAFKYLWYQLVYGYERNPYEIEARKMEGQ